MLWLPLPSRFRYVHEPLPVDEGVIPVLGHEDLAQALREHLLHSRGGTFLVTGFQGVGKSTLVNRALAETAAAWDAEGGVLLVARLNLARSMTADQLLFAIVRRLFEELTDRSVLPLLPRDVQQSLLTAYTRTSLSFTQTQSESSERAGGIGAGASQGPLSMLPLGVNRTKARTSATEAAFLAYSETDVEHDLVRIIQLLNGPTERPGGAPGPPPRRGRRARRRAAHRLRVHPVIVLDEIDKLTDGRSEALDELESLLRRLKGVLTAQGAHFILVAGPDLHDRVVDQGIGCNGVYESVVSWQAYVHCLWNAPQRLIDGLTSPEVAPLDSVKLTRLTRYLRFKAKGIPRRLLQEFNSLVSWEQGQGPCLRVAQADWARIEFYGQLEEITQAAVAVDNPARLAPSAIDDDRWRMGGYQVVEWVLRSEGRPFAVTDVAGEVEPALGVSAPGIDHVLRHLMEAKVLEVTREGGQSDVTVYGNAQDAHLSYYKLTDAYRSELARLHGSKALAPLPGMPAPVPVGPDAAEPDVTEEPPERALVAADTTRRREEASKAPWQSVSPDASDPPITVLAGRYALVELISQGGMGALYRGRDLLTGLLVAAKMMHVGRARDEEALTWFRREAEICRFMHHPNIVTTLDVLLEPTEPEPAIIQEFIDAPSLAVSLSVTSTLPPEGTVLIARQLSQALGYLSDIGLARIDLKPSNIRLHPVRGAVITDLGRVLKVNDETATAPPDQVVGTPSYMAPEQLSGGLVDIRSDLYSLGLLMIHCLTGKLPGGGQPIAELQLQRLTDKAVTPDDLPISPELRALIARATARSPDDRFPTPYAFQDALDATPEGRAQFGLIAREETTTVSFPRRHGPSGGGEETEK